MVKQIFNDNGIDYELDTETNDIKECGACYSRVTPVLNLGLSEDNFIMKYIRYASELTDAYPEYHYATALSILSAITKRKIVCHLSIDSIYPNLWIWALGISTYSKKSTAMKKGEDFLDECGVDNGMYQYFSPEGLTEYLDKHPISYLWIDEAGQMLANFQKPYMGEIKDTMCRLYDGRGFSKILRTSRKKDVQTEFHVKRPYVTQFLMTTPDRFKESTSTIDVVSGWLLRYLYFCPEYTKPWKGIRSLDSDDIVKRKEIVNMILSKIKFFDAIQEGHELEIHINNDAMEYWNNWQQRSYEDIGKTRDEYTGALMGRLQIYVIKLAMVFEIGNNGWNVTLKNMEEACRQVDEYFLPVARALIEDVGMNESKNIIDKVMGLLKRNNGKMYRSQLLQKCKISVRIMNDVLETLEESKQVEWNRTNNMVKLR